jgi:hypothetical protein
MASEWGSVYAPYEPDAMTILRVAQQREDRQLAAHKPIDYARMNRMYPKQKAALTRAMNAWRASNPDRFSDVLTPEMQKVVLVCRETVKEWDEIGCWPDQWNHWQIALDDVLGRRSVRLESLR